MEATAESKRNAALINIVEVNADNTINQKKQVTFNKKRESSEEETETISAQPPLINNGESCQSNNETYSLKEIGGLEELYCPFQVDDIDAHFEGDVVVKKKKMRKAQMKRRLDHMLDHKDSARASSKAKNDIILATSPKIDLRNLTKEVQSVSRDSERSNRKDDANNSSQQSHEFLSDCISQAENQPQAPTKGKNMTASKINETDHLEKPVASILKQPTGISNKDKDDDSQFQKQRSIKFRKQVSISEEPRVIQQAEKLALVNGQQSDGTMFSVSSLEKEENKNLSKERPSVTEQLQEDKHSIISEEDSAFEEQTPKDANMYAHGKMFGGVRRSQDQQDFSSSIKRRPDKLNIQRKKTNPQKIVKTNQASSDMIIVVDDRKQKVKRIQTMENEQQKTRSKLHKNIHGSPSFTRGVEQDRHSLTSKQYNKSNSLYSQRREMEKSGQLKMENLMVPNMYRKQATQDHRDRKGRQRKFVSPEEQVLTTGRKSRNTSLNLTVDNQLDHLSVNFGRRGDRDQNVAQGANLSVLSGLSSKKKAKFAPKRGRQIDQILATSKHDIPPHSTDKFVKKNYIRSSYQSQIRQSIRSRVSDEKSISQDFSSNNGARRLTNEDVPTASLKNATSPNCERPGLDINAKLNKANRKMIQIYMKTPYKVQFYNPIMSYTQSKSPQTQRLYQAENQLKISKNIHLMSRPKKSHIKHQDQKDPKGGMNTARRGTVGSNKNLGPEVLKYARQYTNTSKQNKEQDYTDVPRGRKTSINKLTQQNIVDPQSSASVFSAVQNVGFSLNGTEIDKNYRKSLSFTEKTKTDKSSYDQAFRIKFYDQLITHIDKRLQNCKGQLTQIKKQKDICDIYGQTLQSINFGDTPYTSVNYGFHKQSTFSSGMRQTSQVDADKLKPIVGGEHVRTSSRFSTREGKKVLKVSNLDVSKEERKMCILESQEQLENEMVVQESARTTKSKMDNNPMNSEEVSVAEGQEDFNPRNIAHIGEHMLQPGSEIEALESMQQAYLMQKSQDDNEFDQTSYNFTNSQGNISESYDLLKQIVTMSSKMGFSHQQMHYLKDKHQMLEECENQLEHQYRNRRFRISPNKRAKRSKKITISNLETSHKKAGPRADLAAANQEQDATKTPVLLYYPEPASQKKIKTEKKGRNLSQFNKTAYQAKIKEHMGSSKNNLVLTSKQSNALDEINTQIKAKCGGKSNHMFNKNNSELKSLNYEQVDNVVDPSTELLSAQTTVLMQQKLQMDSRQFKKKLDDKQVSINNKIQMEIAELRHRQKEKIELQLQGSKFKRSGNRGGFSISKNQGEEHQMVTHKNVGDLSNYHGSGSKQPKVSKTNFIKQNIRNLAPLTNTFYPLQQGTSQQLTPKNSTGSRHPELWGKKQQLAPIEKDWDKAQSQKFNHTQKEVQSFSDEVSPVIIKHKNSSSSHYYNSSFQEQQKKNSRLIHSGQQMIGRNKDKSYNNFSNNNQKHKTAVSQSHNQRNHGIVGAMRISESNRQLINKYSPRLPQLESDPASLKRKVQQIRSNNQVALDQKELQAKTTPPPIATSSRSVYQQINQNSLNQQSQYGRSNINQYKQTEVLKNVIKNQRNLSNRIKTNANSINRSYYPAINQGYNLSNIADQSIAVQQDPNLTSEAPKVSAGLNLRLVNNQSDINQSGSMQFRQESQDVPQYQTLDAHGLPSARNSQNNQNSMPNGFMDTGSQIRAASKLNAPAQ